MNQSMPQWWQHVGKTSGAYSVTDHDYNNYACSMFSAGFYDIPKKN